MGDINLPCALEHPGLGDNETVLLHRATINESRGVAQDEHLNLGRVAEAVVADGNPAYGVGRNVIEENQPERKAAEQIEPEIAFGRNRGHVRRFFRALFRS